MTSFVVASGFRWDEYPGFRPGRLASGKGDVGRTPLGESHLVEGLDAAETVCGLPRAAFPHDFPALAQLGPSASCATCQVAATS